MADADRPNISLEALDAPDYDGFSAAFERILEDHRTLLSR
jgi:hypothetical protein